MTGKNLSLIYRGLALQALDDTAPTTSDAYAAFLDFRSSSGTLLTRLAADAVHHHWGVYTRQHPLDSAKSKRVKRLNLDGGSPNTQLRLMGGPRGTTRLWIDSDVSAILDLDGPSGRIAHYVNGGRYRWTDLSPDDDVALLSVDVGPDSPTERTFDFQGNRIANAEFDVPGHDHPEYVSRDAYDALEARVSELEQTLASIRAAIPKE